MSPITKKSMIDKSEALNLSADVLKREDLIASTMDSASNSSMHGGNGKSGSSSSRQYGRVNRIVLDKNSDEYKKRRERNNMAVKKSRNKSKARTQQTMQRVTELKEENERLETKVKILSKELSFLKDLFLAHAGSAHNGQIDLNLYNGSHEAVSSNTNAPINSNIISSTGLTSTAIDCNSAVLQEDKLSKSLAKSHDNGPHMNYNVASNIFITELHTHAESDWKSPTGLI